jgi:hypothetical protein
VNPSELRPSASVATSHRRSAQPSSTAMMARARNPFVVVMSGAFRSACARRRSVSHPDRRAYTKAVLQLCAQLACAEVQADRIKLKRLELA